MLGLKTLSWALTQLFQELYKTRTKAMCVHIAYFLTDCSRKAGILLNCKTDSLCSTLLAVYQDWKSDQYHLTVDALHAVLDNFSDENELNESLPVARGWISEDNLIINFPWKGHYVLVISLVGNSGSSKPVCCWGTFRFHRRMTDWTLGCHKKIL